MSNLVKNLSKIKSTRLLIFFTRLLIIGEESKLHIADYQTNTKETLPRMVKSPFLQCKDNTFISEMQIAILRQGLSEGKKLLHLRKLHLEK